jgi:hypothetical protein
MGDSPWPQAPRSYRGCVPTLGAAGVHDDRAACDVDPLRGGGNIGSLAATSDAAAANACGARIARVPVASAT